MNFLCKKCGSQLQDNGFCPQCDQVQAQKTLMPDFTRKGILDTSRGEASQSRVATSQTKAVTDSLENRFSRLQTKHDPSSRHEARNDPVTGTDYQQ